MIYNHLSQLHLYKNLSSNISKAINFVLKTDFTKLEKGKYEIENETIFAIVNEFYTLPIEECLCESHKRYIDLHILINGTERLGFDNLKNQKGSEYHEENDVIEYDNLQISNFITLKENEFIFFFPNDIHQPEICVKKPELVKKVVIKIENK